LKLSTKKR